MPFVRQVPTSDNLLAFPSLQQFRKYNPVLAQFYVQPRKGEPQSSAGGRGPGEAFLSFSVALWFVGYFYPYVELYTSKIYAMAVLVACTYLVITRRPDPSIADPTLRNKLPPQPISQELQLFLRIHVVYIFLSLLDRMYDLAENISSLWPYWVIVIATFSARDGKSEPFVLLPLTLAVRFIAMAGSALVPSLKTEKTEAIHQPEQYGGFFAEVLPEVYEVLECIAFDLRTPVIWIVSFVSFEADCLESSELGHSG
ncbi:hypothetical protein QFC22_005259 [Naganishia vaughanmartiniae]|uniref:Uncharacterized protein n=1 Tax=Naganishia vaughanmartiniae TaxID=1424756 RepID=A0ACC2WWI2_9TREE|nr:hypothetical protein QFC22_005259 [Naganishia vaughanmartiniae]